MKKRWWGVIAALLLVGILLSACGAESEETGSAETLAPFSPRLDTGDAFSRAAENNPLDRALENEINSAAGGTDEGLIEIYERYGDYWFDEMENAFSLAVGAADEKQAQALENEQESFLIHLNDRMKTASLLTEDDRLSVNERRLIAAQAQLEGYRLRALELYEYHHLLTLGYGVQGEVKIGFLFQEEDVL